MSDDLTKPAPDELEAPTTLPGDLDTPAAVPLPAPPPAGRGVTAHGWPYVEPDDHPLQYPAVSHALAEKLDTDMAAKASRAYVDERLNGNGSIVLAATVTSGGDGNVKWTYPTGFSTGAPMVVATPIGAPSDVVVRITGQTLQDVTLRCVFRATGDPAPAIPIHLIAVGL